MKVLNLSFTLVSVVIIGTLPNLSNSSEVESSSPLRKDDRHRRRDDYRYQHRRRQLNFNLGQYADPRSEITKQQSDAVYSASDGGEELLLSPRPNILFLLLDQWRPDWDGQHPNTRTGPLPLNMPFLDDMARRGARFTQAYVPSPFCGPSRACLAFGKEYDSTGVMDNKRWPVDHTQWTTVYKLLRDEGGYHTMSCGKDDFYEWDYNFPKYANNPNNMPLMDLGFSDAIRSDGKVRVAKDADELFKNEAYRTFLNGITVTKDDGTEINARQAYKGCMTGLGVSDGCDATSFQNEIYPDDFVRDKAIELLNRKPAGKPWFMQVNFPGPHPPIVSTSRMAASVIERKWPDPINNPGFMRCPQQTQMLKLNNRGQILPPQIDGRCNYAAELENLDALMFSIVKHVEEMGELKNTLVIVAGDHGENLGDNGESGKGMPWHASVSTPLFIMGPGVRVGRVHDCPVSTLDLGGTWLEYAGIGNVGPRMGMTTTSLRSILSQDMSLPRRSYVSSGYLEWRTVIKEMPTSPEDQSITSYKLICCKSARGMKGAPKSATPFPKGAPWHVMLYDTIRDPDDLIPLDQLRPDVIAELLPLLPEGWCR
jgi:arylsulfatase A-like enzyme